MNTYLLAMAVRPPQQGGDTPDILEFGIAALDARLSDADVQFPATGDEVVRALDNAKIPIDASGNDLSIADALDEVPRSKFENKTQLLDQLHPVFEEHRASAGGGILQQLRSLLPF
jgi:hypothetical protein